METVILMAKAPVAGLVKTRLSPPLAPCDAARIYEGMLLDTTASLLAVPRTDRLLFFAPPGAKRYFTGGPFAGFPVRPQGGSSLGERMTRALDVAFSEGARRVAIMGADCPGLSPNRIGQAFRDLRGGADAVFGPTPDGGFYLAGFTAFPGGLFGNGVAWGGDSVLSTITARCRMRGIAWSLLPEERDIDTPEDLSWLGARLAAGCLPRCHETRKRLILSG
jgi:rSAM/selenodomain-associated transferase 1